MNCRRRGIMLTQVLAVLPLIVLMTTVSYQLTQRAIRYQGVLRRQLAGEARMESLARQLRADAAGARLASTDSPGGESLVLSGSAEPATAAPAASEKRTIIYQLSESQVTRTVKAPGAAPLVTTWAELPGRMQVQVEAIAGRPGVLWTTWTTAAPTDAGRGRLRKMAVAAVIGGGA